MGQRARKIIGNGIALLFGCLFALGILEIGLRIYNPIHVPLRANDIALPVNQVFKYRVEGAKKLDSEIVLHHNSHGLRGPEIPKDFGATTSFVTVGGSTTACVGLTETHAWPYLLEKRLTERYSDFWLNNAGLNGHSTFGHIMLFRQVLSKLRPDYAILLFGVNDVGRDDLNEYDAKVNPSHADGFTPIVRRSELLSLLQVIWRSLRAYDLGLARNGEVDFDTLGNLVYDAQLAQLDIEEHLRKFIPKYENRVRLLVSESRAAGIEPILMTQPAVYGAGIDPESQRDLGVMDIDGKPGQLRWELLELYNEVTRRVARDAGVMLIDAARAMPKDSRLYSDFIHYSKAGARKMAEIVGIALEEAILTPKM